MYPFVRNSGVQLLTIAGTLLLLSCVGHLAAEEPQQAESPDRQVAEWTILMCGSVCVERQTDRIGEIRDLPVEDFQLELVDLVGTNILPPDLQRLIGLKRLKTLNLPGPMWNPSSGATIDYSRDLRHIAGIKTLEALTFSYTYLESIKF